MDGGSLVDARTPVEVSVPTGVRFGPVAGLVAVPQHTVRDRDGRFVARVDLAFPERRVAIEYDGAWHGEPGQLARDRRRLNALVVAGWTVLHVTAADLHEPAALVARVRALLGAATAGEWGFRRAGELQLLRNRRDGERCGDEVRRRRAGSTRGRRGPRRRPRRAS